ncbi:unnamed protein product [Coffea canephora]|uniref:Uncharacterized protein n=1 Tax=Coffea canephora TaxID=49390 RepID=A0A068V8J6_COFCA|nr:unnamed protein product [Coffea canephora]
MWFGNFSTQLTRSTRELVQVCKICLGSRVHVFGQRTPTFLFCSYENVKREELFSLISQFVEMMSGLCQACRK